MFGGGHDARMPVVADACPVSAKIMQIAIDVQVEGEEINGHASDGIGSPKPFSGWLGLIGALDGLLSSPRAAAVPPSVRICLGFATAEQASAFAGSAALRDAIQDAGTTGPPQIWVSRDGDAVDNLQTEAGQ
jgi:hypothetical protein